MCLAHRSHLVYSGVPPVGTLTNLALCHVCYVTQLAVVSPAGGSTEHNQLQKVTHSQRQMVLGNHGNLATAQTAHQVAPFQLINSDTRWPTGGHSGSNSAMATQQNDGRTVAARDISVLINNAIQQQDRLCPLCYKVFTNTYNMKQHLVVHTGIKPHSCTVCGAGFGRQSSLRRHYLHIHKNLP